MKRIPLLAAALSFAVLSFAQNKKPIEIHNANGSTYKKCFYVRSTRPLSEIAAEEAAKGVNKSVVSHVSADADARANFNKNPHPALNGNLSDGALQSVMGDKRAQSIIENFEGSQSITGGYPMDPNGMVGTTYYVQTVNSSIEIFTKTGTPVVGPTLLSGLFGNVGSQNCGDPVTIYDKTADRWVITEFEGCQAGPIDTLLMAVSQTNNPSGSYWIYAFDPNISNTDDYPKYHVWGDGYYLTCNCGNSDLVAAFQRDSMLVGSINAGMITIPWGGGPYNLFSCGGNFFCPMMLDADGTLPPFGSPEYLFYYWDDNWGCGGVDSICIEKISVNWNTQSGSYSNYQHLPTAAFNSYFPGGFDNNIPQPGGTRLASLDGFFNYRIPYLRWSSYNSCVMVNPISVNGDTSGLRWYELRQDTTTKLWSIHQQSTYAPNDGISRWNPSIAMDNNGDIGLAYSVSDPNTVNPGIRYTGRRVCDPLNTMTIAEATVVNGNTAVVTPQNGGNRWGDYSLMSIDPSDGITFWYTNMYANSSYGPQNMDTRIFSFRIPSCPLLTDNVSEPITQLTAYQNGAMLVVKGAQLKVGERVVVELYDVNGKRLAQQEFVPNGSNLQTTFNVSSLARAIYIVRLGNDSFQRAVKIALQ